MIWPQSEPMSADRVRRKRESDGGTPVGQGANRLSAFHDARPPYSGAYAKIMSLSRLPPPAEPIGPTVADGEPEGAGHRPRIALLSNPKSTGNLAQLPRIRAYCDGHRDVFHYEVERADQIGEALRTIARIKPRILVINGGDGTVQTTLTEIVAGRPFGDAPPPPVAVLPSGKTNLIALDLGAHGDPVTALDQLLELARHDLAPFIVARELISLSGGVGAGARGGRPVIGMFLGGAGLADIMLYCRNRIYPLGLPNAVSHGLAAIALLFQLVFGWRASFLPPEPRPLSIRTHADGKVEGRFTLLLVTTLERLLLSSDVNAHGAGKRGSGPLKFIAVEQKPWSLLRALAASIAGRLGQTRLDGVHIEGADQISIEGDAGEVILDGESFRTGIGQPIVLTTAAPLSFVRLAA